VSDRQIGTSFIVLGDVMVDTFARVTDSITLGSDQPAVISRQVGGQGANTAAWLAWLQTSVILIAVCGEDSSGTWVAEQLIDAGVDPHLHRVRHPTGSCVVIVDSEGTRTMFSDPGANQQITNFSLHALPSILESSPLHPHVHLSGYLLERDPDLPRILVESTRTAARPVTTSLDTAALVPTAIHRTGLVRALPYLDVLIGTQDELTSFADLPSGASPLDESALIDHWRTHRGFSGVLVIKRGAHGATADDGRERLSNAAIPASVVDTTGAGDAFSAGFLAAWSPGQDTLESALRSGTEVAAMAVARLGAGPPSAEGR
jgi:ribokinase